ERSYPVEFPVDVPTTSTYATAIEGHRSQVYVNGLASDEDTLVRVKHRREKSNSIGNVVNGAARRLRVRSTASSTTTEGDDASGNGPDSDEDDDGSCPSHESFVDLKDSVRECLEKEPSERNAEDLAVLLDFMQHMSSFASLPMSIKRQLCLKMVFAVVNDAGTVVMHHNEKLDAWSVIVNGLVEVVKPNGERVEYKLGDSFGAEPNPAVQYHVGEMRTMVDDCEFVLIEHKDFCSIMSTIGEHIEKDRDGLTGEVVSETERRTVGNQVGLVLIKGKPDKLIQHLVDDRDSNVDPHYVDDFLLTYRVFIHNPTIIFEKLMMWFADGALRDKIARIVLLWVNNHYNDFETNDEMNKLLERFEGALERDGMHSQQSLLNIACSVKARPRVVDNCGKECGCGIFVSEVQPDSPAERCGLKRGDEVLEVNGQPMKYLTLVKAHEIMKDSISLTINLKSNILGFKELLGKILAHARGSVPNVIPVKTAKTVKFTGQKTSMMDKLMTILKSSKEGEDVTDEIRTANSLRPSRSNPDITSISQYYGPVKSECPEHVLKIYRSDQTFKYLAVYKETTAQNVVQLALQEFNMTAEGSLEWSLCECTVTEDGVIKQRRLPAQMQNLAERIALNSRYYLKNNNRSEPLVPDDLAPEIMRESQAQLLALNAQVVAAQLTLQDFAVFASIEPTDHILNCHSCTYGSPRLEEFERIFNREMWWVATEVCSEHNIQKRAKLIKKFIKVARHCRELRNFNSMFAIMSGLDKPAVRRLHSTWDRVAGKYTRMLEDVQQLVDPSRNMSKYRQHLAEVSQEPPVVPIYPVIKKDLTFSHEGNPTYCDKLVNFEKLRLIAKSVRAVSKLSSAPYEISSMAERSGGTISDALLHMNTFEGGNVATMRKGGRVVQPRKKVYHSAEKVCFSAPRMRRAPSPSPSSLSSQSAESNSTDQRRLKGGGMFGVDSPQAVQKMLGLVQTSKSKGQRFYSLPSSTGAKGLQRNVRQIPSRQHSQEPVDLNKESSSVTSFYGAGKLLLLVSARSCA
ncbi:unnamed protein product, partial [Heligmosomoides polygyrus]|uniref:Camp-regulated guanine nucleotide exchange factor n=1 Tax=Heligmosomoides polygyrus TaxID=6339 RepID=A0A183GGD2_HELPZ